MLLELVDVVEVLPLTMTGGVIDDAQGCAWIVKLVKRGSGDTARVGDYGEPIR